MCIQNYKNDTKEFQEIYSSIEWKTKKKKNTKIDIKLQKKNYKITKKHITPKTSLLSIFFHLFDILEALNQRITIFEEKKNLMSTTTHYITKQKQIKSKLKIHRITNF